MMDRIERETVNTPLSDNIFLKSIQRNSHRSRAELVFSLWKASLAPVIL
jgi:hypothetical protein